MDKPNTIFKLNNILLSAYSEDTDIFNLLTKENEELTNTNPIDKGLVSEYEILKSGSRYQIQEASEPNLTTAVHYLSQGKYPQSFYEFLRLLKKGECDKNILKNICSNLLVLKDYHIILEYFMDKLDKYKDDIEILNIMASALYSSLEHYREAIPLLEKLVKHYPKDGGLWFKLAFSIERTYQDKYLDKQLEYMKKALKYSKNDTTVQAFYGKLLYRNGQKQESAKCFNKIMKNNPKPDDIIVYSRFLMKEKRLEEAYKYYRERFKTGLVSYPKALSESKRWDGKSDLSNSTVIVHYEQGFGDSVMFSRYIKDLSKLAKKVIFVVQKNLIPVLKSSGFEDYCEILSHEADINPNIKLEDTNRSVMYSKGDGMSLIPHDYHIPIMDLPYLMKASPYKMVGYEGYLKVDKQKIEKFRKKYINDNKLLKIGLSFHGTKESILTYRDVAVKYFLPLLTMEGVEFYSLQADKYADELKTLDKNIHIVNLGKKFKNFEDTACAMNCMDLIISTDNVVMNLGGALGLKTYGLFNVYTESRWYNVEGDDIGWYKSVKPFHAKTFNDWEGVITQVKQEIKKNFKLK